MIEIRELGLRDYLEVWELQKELVELRAEGHIDDTLLLVEHPPVFTTGSSAIGIPGPLPFPVHHVERGGDATYHGPGQLVGYPILHLRDLGLSPRSALRFMEEVLIDAVSNLGIEGGKLPGFTGVWAQGKKIASLGIAVRRSVSYHGFALNVDMDLAPFRLINPCRLEPEGISCLSELLQRPVALSEALAMVRESFSRHWNAVKPALAVGRP